ncbi:hypothetical protein CH379_018435 [Leptospira ellisii]|uniref:Uncharacterized protein n=1 Tax=Leptospira ellisii TaxID=2023197 RepID=A0A2N0B590_9LEPT|nr:hypothetical protein [Leptospira ellisii]MDV6237615.1 hypothetical protein [Leptospira ellisii]PJZ91686.1 hypothetical protein CH379_17265 [Leptospira ellisii]PKA02905.1 hypothetical protein CH375_20160 [Leptospira ellisii]
MSGEESRYQIQVIKLRLLSKEISYEKARELATPHLKELNEIGKRIAEKHRRKHYPLTFTGMMR